jgi:general secretion pathway protein C
MSLFFLVPWNLKAIALSLTRSLPPALARALSGDALPRLLAVVGTALVAGQLALLTWKFLPSKAPAAAPAAPLALSGPSTDNASRVFGQPPPPDTGVAAPQTNISLTLVGTLAVKDPTAGLAIVGPAVTDAHVYATGTDIAPGIRLVEVYPDHVIIDRGGTHESLMLPHTGGGVQMSRAPALADVAKQAAAAPEVIGDLMRPMPNYVAGQLRGFKLFPGRDRRRFNDLGLQPGDMVTQVNGVPISDAQHGLEMLQSLGSATSATVTVERGGVIQSITIDSSQLSSLSDASRRAPGAGAAPATTPAEPTPSNE